MHITSEPIDEAGDDLIQLRPWRTEDAGAMAAAVRESLDTLLPWLSWCTPDYALPDAAARIEACRKGWETGELFAFAVIERRSGELAGSVGLNQINRIHHSGNAGYWIGKRNRGRGLASRALRLAARFGFEQLGLIRIEVIAEPGNLASRRTAERAGARFEAIARHRLWIRDRAADAAVYSLLPADLE